MVSSDEIIILHYTRFSEKAVVLHCLSKTSGRCGYMVKDASRQMAFFQPLSILECEVTSNPKSSLSTIKNIWQKEPLNGIRNSVGKNAISMFMAEVVYRSTREGTLEGGLFEWFKEEIALLDALQCDYSNFHIRFLLDLAGAMGFMPDFDAISPFLEDSAPAVQAFMDCSFADSMLIPLSGSMRSTICTRLIKYLECHLDYPLKIRSLAVLAELF